MPTLSVVQLYPGVSNVSTDKPSLQENIRMTTPVCQMRLGYGA